MWTALDFTQHGHLDLYTNTMRELEWDQNAVTMCSFDISSPFMNVPLQETIDICTASLFHSNCEPPCISEAVFVELKNAATRAVEFPSMTIAPLSPVPSRQSRAGITIRSTACKHFRRLSWEACVPWKEHEHYIYGILLICGRYVCNLQYSYRLHWLPRTSQCSPSCIKVYAWDRAVKCTSLSRCVNREDWGWILDDKPSLGSTHGGTPLAQHATRLPLWIPLLIESGPSVHPADLLLKLIAFKPFSMTMATLSDSSVGSYSAKLPVSLRTLYLSRKVSNLS